MRSFNSLCVFIGQLVIPGETQAAASSLLSAPYFPKNTVDGETRQEIAYCMHTKNEGSITEAWLRINLLDVYSIKQVKFWYRGDSMYHFVYILI